MAERDGGPAAGSSPLSGLRRELAAIGFRPSRRRGQNFLLDPNAARAIVRDAQVVAGDRVLEIGVGCGALTMPLVELGVELVAVEIDERLLELTRARVEAARGRGPAPIWIRCDALESKRALAPQVADALRPGRAWHLVSSLPYSISAPLLAVLASRQEPPRSMTVLVQREVADRLCARPGSREYGPLTVAVGLAFRSSRLRELPPRAFWPRPKIRSSLLRLVLQPDRPPPDRLRRIVDLTGGLLQRRRQALGRVLGERIGDRARGLEILGRLGIDPRRRAEELDPELLGALSDALEEVADGGPGRT